MEHIAPRPQPAGYVGGSLLVMDFTDEEWLCRPKDSFTAPQDSGFRTFHINLDQAWQRVLLTDSVQCGRLNFDRGFPDG
jgi:hypothetical protein